MMSGQCQLPRRCSSPSITASIGPPTDGGGLTARSQSPTVRRTGGRTSGVYSAEVEVGDEATVGGHVVDHRPADLAGGEHRRALARDEAEHVGQGVVGDDVAGHDRRPVGAGHDPEGVRVAAEQRVRDVGQVARGRPTDGVAVATGRWPTARRRRPTDSVPSSSTASWQAVTAPGVATEPWPANIRHAAAVVGDDLVHAATEALDGEPAARHLDVAVDDHRVTRGRPHGHEGPARERDDARLGAHRGERGGDGDVDGVAAGQRDLAPGRQRRRPGRRDRHPSHVMG